MDPPPPMLPPKLSKAMLPGPMGPPPMKPKPSPDVVVAPTPELPLATSPATANVGSSQDLKEVRDEGTECVAGKVVEAPKAKVAGEPISSGPPYTKPSWSAAPGCPFKLEVLKEGVVMGNYDVSKKGAYMFGRSDRCDFTLEHPTASRYHAVLQYNNKGEAFIYDLGSTHGTFINKRQVKAKVYAPIQVGGIVRFGLSTRLYVLQGPAELMPEEGLSRKERLALKVAEAAQHEAIQKLSLQRAKAEAAALEGASWGMMEDAEEDEEEEENLEELTWQTYKGPLTEKQQKTLEKVHKRNEKMANLKKENDAIKAKETGQGGLTQGQQTQMARNEQRLEQIMEELESLEETLNESIQESVGARTGKTIKGRKISFEDEEEDDSDDDFYDRTSKRPLKKNGEVVQKVETAESLLEKRDVLAKEMDVVSAELKAEEAKTAEKEESEASMETVDPLDAFMSSVSTNIVKDKAARLSKELAKMQTEADRIARLLKIADPGGDASRKWESQCASSTQSIIVDNIVENRLRLRASKESAKELASQHKLENSEASSEAINTPSDVNVNMDSRESTAAESKEEIPFLAAPLLLGAPRPEPIKADTINVTMVVDQDTETASEFVGYKDRKRAITENDGGITPVSNTRVGDEEVGHEGGIGASDAAVEAVALLLRHKTGLTLQDELEERNKLQTSDGVKPAESKARGKKKRKLGPERPPMLNKDSEELEEAWVPPQGQTGDGRTSLNEKFGY